MKYSILKPAELGDPGSMVAIDFVANVIRVTTECKPCPPLIDGQELPAGAVALSNLFFFETRTGPRSPQAVYADLMRRTQGIRRANTIPSDTADFILYAANILYVDAKNKSPFGPVPYRGPFSRSRMVRRDQFALLATAAVFSGPP